MNDCLVRVCVVCVCCGTYRIVHFLVLFEIGVFVGEIARLHQLAVDGRECDFGQRYRRQLKLLHQISDQVRDVLAFAGGNNGLKPSGQMLDRYPVIFDWILEVNKNIAIFESSKSQFNCIVLAVLTVKKCSTYCSKYNPQSVKLVC